MISKEQLAHDLTMVYLNNRYGISVDGYFHVSDGDGSGNIDTKRFPSPFEINYDKVGTGERGFLGFEKKVRVKNGYTADGIIDRIIQEYHQIYNIILGRLDMQ